MVGGGTDILARDDPPSIKPLVSPVFKKSHLVIFIHKACVGGVNFFGEGGETNHMKE